MAVTLAQAQKLTQDKLAQQIICEFRKDPLFEAMIFDDCVSLNGGSTLNYVYNRITTLATADFRAINNEYTAQEAETTLITTTLKPFGGSAELDRIIATNVKGVSNQVAFQLEQKIKAVKALFSDTFINGDSAVKVTSFDGINKAVAGSSTEHTPTDAIDLSTSTAITTNANVLMDALDKMLSEMSETPDAIMMNRKLKAIMNGIARRSGYFSTSDKDAFGVPVTKYQGITLMELGDKPGSSNPIIPISSATGTEGHTSLYAVKFSLAGTHAVTPSGQPVINQYLPDFKSPGAVKKLEVEMVAAVAVKATRSIAALRKIKVQ